MVPMLDRIMSSAGALPDVMMLGPGYWGDD